MTGRVEDHPLEETLVVDLPAPVGRLRLYGSNATFARFRRLTRDRGIGPPDPSGRPSGIDLRNLGGGEIEKTAWGYLDYETCPLLVFALAERQHPRLKLEALEDACTPRVIEQIGEPLMRYLLTVLRPILLPAEGNGEAPPDPPTARGTSSDSSGRSGPTP